MVGLIIKNILKGAAVILILLLGFNVYRSRRKISLHVLKDAGMAAGKRLWIALFAALIFGGTWALSSYVVSTDYPKLFIKYKYGEASKGQNPNGTRFNVSDLLSSDILEKVIERGNLDIEVSDLQTALSIHSVFDEAEISTDSPNMATEYWIEFTPTLNTLTLNAREILNFLGDVYYEDFLEKYSENSSILELDFSDIDQYDYTDYTSYFTMKATELNKLIGNYAKENSTFRVGVGETFSAIAEKLDNFINTELEGFSSFVNENGLTKDKEEYLMVLDYKDRLLQLASDKDMASYNVMLEAIEMYDRQMATIVLVPSQDQTMEFYMSRTKIGADDFADDAKNFLASATSRNEEISTNRNYADKVSSSTPTAAQYQQADEMVEQLKADLQTLADDGKKITNAYIKEKRKGYVTITLQSLSTKTRLSLKKSAIIGVGFGVLLLLLMITSQIKELRKH